jgi:hypothetical protein
VFTLIILLLVMAGHWLLYLAASAVLLMLGLPDANEALSTIHSFGLTPWSNLAALVTFGRVNKEPAHPELMWERLQAAVMGMLLYAAVAWLLWLRLRARFGAICGRLK